MESEIINNLYPAQFFKFGQTADSELVSDQEINSEIHNMVGELKADSKIFSMTRMIGNVKIDVNVIDSEDNGFMHKIVVSKNYESVYLDAYGEVVS